MFQPTENMALAEWVPGMELLWFLGQKRRRPHTLNTLIVIPPNITRAGQPGQEYFDLSNGSGALFSMYLDSAMRENSEMAERWKRDANQMLFLVGLQTTFILPRITISRRPVYFLLRSELRHFSHCPPETFCCSTPQLFILRASINNFLPNQMHLKLSSRRLALKRHWRDSSLNTPNFNINPGAHPLSNSIVFVRNTG
jgi:hypothetical protein